MKRAPMDKNCLSNFSKVIFQPAFLWDMWVNCCLTAQAGGVDPFAVGIQPWLREPRDDYGLAWVSQTRMCFLTNKNGFFMMVVWGSLHFGIWEIFSEGITLHLDSPVNLCDFFHPFLFSLHITEVEQLYIALHDLGHVQKEEGWRQAAKSCKKSRCVVRFLCGRGCKKTPHAEIGNWYTPTVYQELEIHSHAFYRSGLFKIIGSARIFNMRSVWMEGQPILGIRNIKFVMFSWVEAMHTT